MTAVTEKPMTIAVTTSAEGIGSTARDGRVRDAERLVDDRRGAAGDIAGRDHDDVHALCRSARNR